MAIDARDRRLAAAVGGVVFVFCASFFGGGGWNQNAQFALTRAIVERQTLAIDAYRDATNDVSFSGGHVYANKAPGVSFFAAVPYAVLHAVDRARGIDAGAWSTVTRNAWICTALVCGGSAALISAALFLAGRSRGQPAVRSALVAIVAVVGTPILPYATMLYAHVPSALLLLVAFLLAGSGRRSVVTCAGAAGGLAVLTNYLCAPALAVIVLLRTGGVRRSLLFIAGALPPLAVLAAYQYAAFGSFLTTSIDTMDPRFVDEGAFMGVFRLPALEALWGITFSPYRGLFVLSPVLLLSVPALVRQRSGSRREVLAVSLIAVYFLLANASFNGWHGGWAIGPRYLIPIVPLLALPLLGAPIGLISRIAAAVSVTLCVMATAVDPQPRHGLSDPFREWVIPHLMSGRVAINPQGMDEIAPLAVRSAESPEAQWASFNLGELLVPGTLSLLPLLLWLLAGGGWIVRRARSIDAACGRTAPARRIRKP